MGPPLVADAEGSKVNRDVSRNCVWTHGTVPTSVHERTRPGRKHRFSQKTADFHRFPPSPANSSIFGGRKKLQKTADVHRKPQETADWGSSSGSVTLSSALEKDPLPPKSLDGYHLWIPTLRPLS